MNFFLRSSLIIVFSILSWVGYSQSGEGIIRGNIFDKLSGEPVAFAAVQLENTNKGGSSDQSGFFSIGGVVPGKYDLKVSFLGYQDTMVNLEIVGGEILFLAINLQPTVLELETFELSARREQAKKAVRLSSLSVSAEEILALPSIGGEADIAQYLTVVPGVISTGDQGGQLFIRGGSPVQNKILLDGIPIYNAFHSIGFFSVFETETIRNVEVLTGGFNAEYGGRVSAVVDIQTREGNKKQWGAQVAANPFQAKAIIEGPIKSYDDKNGTSISLLVSAKQSLIDQSSKVFYDYALDTSFFAFAVPESDRDQLDEVGLPYQYQDLFAKLSFNAGKGSQLDVVAFNFQDEFDLLGVTNLNWNAFGLGANFRIVPPASDIIIDGSISFSDYLLTLKEQDGFPRSSGIENVSAQLMFSYFGSDRTIQYGFDFTGFNTNFQFQNLIGLGFEQADFTSELAGFLKYRQQFGKLIAEPGLRLHYYASQAKMSFEPRLGLKYNATDQFRLKLGAGRYAQNVVSTQNDLDVINFFSGFIAGPEETIFKPGTREATDNRLQTALHAVFGAELDIGKRLELNVETYFKDYVQLIGINRNKLTERDPDFITESGEAYGIDVSGRLEFPKGYLWTSYSLSYVNRNDGEQVYPTVFDRRHNVNMLAVRKFGKTNDWEFSVRWNFGSAFPFTQTQGFFQNVDFGDLLQTDIVSGNFPIGILLADDRNGGRLSAYHRLDIGLKRTFILGNRGVLDFSASVTNAYNRDNIFYVDRLTNARINQLPILPSLGISFKY